MKIPNKPLFYILILSLISPFIQAQHKDNRSFSIFTGGIIIGKSHLSTTKIGMEFNKYSILTDFTYDDYSETWDDGSSSKFQIVALSFAGRYYLKPLGRGIFAELYSGLGKSIITTVENGQTKNMSDIKPFSGFGLGWRFGKKPKGIFGEIAYRYSISWKESHLYTTDIKPNTNNLESFSYQSWYTKKGEGTSQLYIGIGYSF